MPAPLIPNKPRMKIRTQLLFLAVALVAAAGGMAYRLDVFSGNGSGVLVRRLHATSFSDLQGTAKTIEQWQGRVLVINFWATWCPPCREEVPLFVRLQEQYGARGLQFIGIALDQPGKVAEFAHEFRVNYPLLIAGMETMELMREAGNKAGVLPYTLIIDRKGNLVGREAGGLKEPRLMQILAPLL